MPPEASEPSGFPDRRFPRSRRLLARKQYDRVFQEGRRIGRPSLLVFIRPQPPAEALHGPRLGLTVSRKVGNAVVRNRVKRRLREAFRLHCHRFTSSTDVVIVARAEAARAPYAQLEAEFLRALEKAGLLASG